MVDMLQLAARGVDELCARLVKGERERCKLQDATTKTLLRTEVRARARALLRMQLCTSVLLRSVVDLVPCRSHQLFAALLHGHARAEEATESHRRPRRSPRSRLPPPRMPPPHWATRGYRGSIARRARLVVNNHNFLDDRVTLSDRESTLGLASVWCRTVHYRPDSIPDLAAARGPGSPHRE